MIKLILLSLLFIQPFISKVFFAETNEDALIFIFHGLGGNCEQIENYQKQILQDDGDFQNVFCVQSGEGEESLWTNFITQIDNAYNFISGVLKNPLYKSKIQNGVFFFGISQGGIIARMIFNCFPDINKVVTRIITYSSPNSGLKKVNVYNFLFNWIPNWALKTDYAKKNVGVNFFHNQDQTQENKNGVNFNDKFIFLNCIISYDAALEYLKNDLKNASEQQKNMFLEHVTNVIEQCAYINDSYSNLDLFVTIMNKDDEVITPPNSAIFGQEFAQIDPKIVKKSIEKLKISNTSEITHLEMQLKGVEEHKRKLSSLNKKLSYKNYLEYLYETELSNFDNIIKDVPNFYYPVQLEKSLFYRHNYLSIRTLSLNNRYLACALNGKHLQAKRDVLSAIVVRLFSLSLPEYKKYNHVGSQNFPMVLLSEKLPMLKLFCNVQDLSSNEKMRQMILSQKNMKLI